MERESKGAAAAGAVSPIMGTIALPRLAYDEGVNFGCVASVATQSV